MGKNNKLYLLKQKGAGPSKLISPTFENERIFKNDGNTYTVPEHASLPPVSDENELLLEAQTIVIFVISMCGQYLNLFRSFWWMSDTFRRYAMNFHLINFEIVLFCTVTIVRPFFIQLFFRLHCYLPERFRLPYMNSVMTLLNMSFYTLQGGLLYKFVAIYPLLDVCKLLLPLAMYILIHYGDLTQALGTSVHSNKDVTITGLISGLFQLLFPSTLSQCPVVPSAGSLVHICANLPPSFFRDEVDKLSFVVNQRLKFVLFRSFLVAYYSSMIPLFFVPDMHEYDSFVAFTQIISTVICTFFMLSSHLASPQFFNVLHKSSLHLGKWQKLETRNTLMPALPWDGTSVYGPGIVVRYAKEYYKSEAYITTAEPGCSKHQYFYTMFASTEQSLGCLLMMLFVFVLIQLAMLNRAHEWYVLISLSLMILTNSLAVFRIMRTYMVLSTIYKQETIRSGEKDD